VIRTIVQLTDEQWVDARECARLDGLSFAAFVRLAIDARLERAESARLAVRQRALAAVDSVEASGRGRGGNGDRRQDGDGESRADEPAEGRAGPRYWLEQCDQ
jgi:hypothetical protein